MKVLLIIFVITSLTFGEITSSLDDRIIGGTSTTIEEYPYQVSIRFNDVQYCGGAIINENTILTAAHCFYGLDHEKFTIRLGSTKHKDGDKYDIYRVIIHPDYNKDANYNNDIAILKLKTKLIFSEKIQPISLQPSGQQVPVGTVGTITGWGTTVPGQDNSPDKLRKVDVDVISIKQCKDAYIGYKITDKMICARRQGKDSCQGDSGGPFAADGKLIGVVSWGFGCGKPQYPGVYANIAVLHDFIDLYL